METNSERMTLLPVDRWDSKSNVKALAKIRAHFGMAESIGAYIRKVFPGPVCHFTGGDADPGTLRYLKPVPGWSDIREILRERDDIEKAA